MSYKKVMHFEDQKNRWMHMPADVVPLAAFLNLNRAVHYYFYMIIYIECRQESRACSKKELRKLVWLYK